jgi:hypothetical protein
MFLNSNTGCDFSIKFFLATVLLFRQGSFMGHLLSGAELKILWLVEGTPQSLTLEKRYTGE